MPSVGRKSGRPSQKRYLSCSELTSEVWAPLGQSKKSRLESLMGAKEHEMHHRGQMMLIERQLGITPHLTRAMQERFAQMQPKQ